MRLPLIAALALCPLAAPAQNLAAEYVAAARVFALTGDNNDIDAQLAQARQRALSAEGDWVAAYLLVGGFGTVDDLNIVAGVVEQLNDTCAQLAFRAVATGPTSFEMRVVNNGEERSFARRFQYIGARSYLVSVDEMALLERLGFTDGREPIASIYFGGQNAGYVQVFLPSANVLVIQGIGAQPEIYLRCPSG